MGLHENEFFVHYDTVSSASEVFSLRFTPENSLLSMILLIGSKIIVIKRQKQKGMNFNNRK